MRRGYQFQLVFVSAFRVPPGLAAGQGVQAPVLPGLGKEFHFTRRGVEAVSIGVGRNIQVHRLFLPKGFMIKPLQTGVFFPQKALDQLFLTQAEDIFLPIAEQKMRATAFGGLGAKVRLETTNFGWRAGVTGAAALALTQFFYNPPEGN